MLLLSSNYKQFIKLNSYRAECLNIHNIYLFSFAQKKKVVIIYFQNKGNNHSIIEIYFFCKGNRHF